MLRTALTILQVFASLAIVLLVLIQRGKGADAGAGFGAGASGTVFGARGARTALSRATAVFAAIFMMNSLALAYMGSRTATPQDQKSVLDLAAENEPATTTPAPVVPSPSSIPAPAPQDTQQNDSSPQER